MESQIDSTLAPLTSGPHIGKLSAQDLRTQLGHARDESNDHYEATEELNALIDLQAAVGTSKYRQVASHCRLPEVYSTVSQILSESRHFSGQTMKSFAVEFAGWANAAGENNPEKIKTGIINLITAIEYPPLSGNFSLIQYGGTSVGTLLPGAILQSDFHKVLAAIPKEDEFALWHYHFTLSNTNGIPTVKGLPSAKYGNTRGRVKLQGGISPVINYLMSQFPEYAHALANTVVDGDDYITPAAIIAVPEDDYDHDAILGFGDSRFVGTTQPDRTDLLAGVGERVMCKNKRPFINASASGRQFFQAFDPSSNLDFNRATHFLRYCDVFGNWLGTNDIARYTSLAVCSALEQRLLQHPGIQGKRIEGLTIPPYLNSSSDYYTSVAGQTPNANNGNVAIINEYRRTNPDGVYDKVYDVASLITDAATGKWKVGPRARTIKVNMALNSDVFDVIEGALAPQDEGVYMMALIGAASALRTGIIHYISAAQGRLTQSDKIMASNGTPRTAEIVVAGLNMYVDARHYAGDVIHDSVLGAIEQGEKAELVAIEF